jgi:hypothetical protein
VEGNTTGGYAGAIGTATATDTVDASPTITNNAPATFPVGVTTTVTWTAKDDTGNPATATQTVTVVDTTAPVVLVPSAITVEAEGPSGTAATNLEINTFLGSASGVDAVDGARPATAVAPPADFPLGSTSVQFSSSDASGNTGFASSIVTVVDTTPPTLSLPGNITTEATGPDGAPVTINATANDLVAGAVAVNCAPASGSTFSLGATPVECVASDASGGDAVSWWPAEFNADDAAGGNDGELVGDADFTQGKVGQAFSFDGLGDLVNIPENQLLDFGDDDFSIAFWVSTSTGSTSALVAKHVCGVPQGYFVLINDPGNGGIGSGKLAFFVGGSHLVSNTSVNDGVFHHVAVTFDAATNTKNIYIDGQLDATGTSGDGVPNDAPFQIGGIEGGNVCTAANTTHPLLGLIDEVKIHDRALSQAEITADFVSPGNASNGSLTVTVVDTTPPELTVPSDVTVEGDTLGGAANVTVGSPSATDIADAAPAAVCDLGGGPYPLGTTTVDCTATDASGNSSSGSFTVTVVDTTPPIVTAILVPVPGKVEDDRGEFTAVFSSIDVVDPDPEMIGVMVTPLLDSLERVFKDDRKTEAKFDLDKGKVEIKAPDGPAQQALLDQLLTGGIVVANWQVVKLRIDDRRQRVEFKLKDDGKLEIKAPSASFFVLKATSEDASGRKGVATASPAFRGDGPPPNPLSSRARLLAVIEDLTGDFTGESKRFEKAIKELNKSLDNKQWLDGLPDPKHGKKVFDRVHHAVKELMHVVKKPKGVRPGGPDRRNPGYRRASRDLAPAGRDVLEPSRAGSGR